MKKREDSEITFEELEKAVMPLVELLKNKGGERTAAIVTRNGVTIYQDITGIPLPPDD
jgi:hypothetical protein